MPEKWEYALVRLSMRRETTEHLLSTHGADGWEMVGITYFPPFIDNKKPSQEDSEHVAVFKRTVVVRQGE